MFIPGLEKVARNHSARASKDKPIRSPGSAEVLESGDPRDRQRCTAFSMRNGRRQDLS